MNNFSDGEFANTKSSFFPKKSFNKIVNMNLLNSKEFMKHNIDSNEQEDFKQNEMNDFIKRSMKFYSNKFIFLEFIN